MAAITADRLGLRGRDAWRLRGFDLAVQPGERIALLGPPGAGKTSLLECFAGLISPTEGSVRVLDQPATRTGALVALLPETGGFDPALTPTEHLELVAELRRFPSAARTGEAIELLSRLDLTEVRDMVARTLSAGRRRAVAVACALMPALPILLLDDPFAGLDPIARRSLDDLLRDRQAHNKTTVVMSTRSPSEAALANRVALIREGRLLVCDTPSALCAAAGPHTIVVRPRDESLSARRIEDSLGVKVYREPDGYRLVVEQGETAIESLIRGFAPAIRAVYVRQPSMETVYLRYFDKLPHSSE